MLALGGEVSNSFDKELSCRNSHDSPFCAVLIQLRNEQKEISPISLDLIAFIIIVSVIVLTFDLTAKR